MSIALDLARLAVGRTSPNPAVGAVIAYRGKILATGFHKGPGCPHAEVEALRKLSSPDAPGKKWVSRATLYVNLEPCCHYGRTPPCTTAILRSGIRNVVIGMKDPDPLVSGKGIRILRRAGVRVETGVLEDECRELNQAYSVHRTFGRPYVILKMAMTLEGYVGWKACPAVREARGRGRLSSALQVTGRAAQHYAHTVRDQVDAILVGVGTILADNPRLTTRLPHRQGRDPLRVILDPSGKTPPDSRVMNLRSTAKTMIVSSPADSDGKIKLKPLLRRLAGQGVVTLLVEGGAQVWSSFLRQKLVDQCLLFVGGRRNKISPTQAIKAPSLLQLPVQKIEGMRLGEDLLVSLQIRGLYPPI